MIGIGHPQNRCRDSSQSRSRKVIARVPRPVASSRSIIVLTPVALSVSPSRIPEFT